MDIFPIATDASSMATRREILVKAARTVGLTLTAPIIGFATPYVRLDNERGDLGDEKNRFERELDYLASIIEIHPATDVLPGLLAVWANIDGTYRVSMGSSAELKSKAAMLAGVNSITLRDPVNGKRWFDAAHMHARLAQNPHLISLVHSREALATLYWSDNIQDAVPDAILSVRHASSPQEKGMGLMMQARVLARMGQRGRALATADSAVNLAAENSWAPRPDRWMRAQAHNMAGRTLATFKEFLPTVESHSQESLRQYPKEAVLLRAHARLNIGEVRTYAREYDGAETEMLSVLRSIPDKHMVPVLFNRIADIIDVADRQEIKTRPMQALRTELAIRTNR